MYAHHGDAHRPRGVADGHFEVIRLRALIRPAAQRRDDLEDGGENLWIDGLRGDGQDDVSDGMMTDGDGVHMRTQTENGVCGYMCLCLFVCLFVCVCVCVTATIKLKKKSNQ